MIWLLLIVLALLVTVVFAAFARDFDRLCAGVDRRIAYEERRVARAERAFEDFCWIVLRVDESEHARDLHLARTAPVMTLNVRAKFMARNTLGVIQ